MHSGAAVPLGSARLACSRAAHDLGNLRFAGDVLDCLAAAGLCTAVPPETQPDLFVETARHAIAIFEYGGVKLRRGCERLFRYVAHVDRRRRIGRPFWFKLFSSPSTFRVCLALGRRENQPTTFEQPFLPFAADFVMVHRVLTGTLEVPDPKPS